MANNKSFNADGFYNQNIGDSIYNKQSVGVAGKTLNTDFSREMSTVHSTLNIPETLNSVRNNNLSNLNAHKLKFPTDAFGRGMGYVFITKPSLNIITPTGVLADNIRALPYLESLYARTPLILESLCYDYKATPFINMLCNSCTSFDIPDEVLKTHNKGETFLGWKVEYGKHAVESRTGFSLSLSFDDNKDLDVYNTIKAWVMYIEAANRGIISPTKYNIENFILDYGASAYYFVLGQDNLNIKFYAKITGIFPTNIPNSVFSTSDLKKVDAPKYSVNFASSFVEVMDPRILAEFNKIGLAGNIIPSLYNAASLAPSNPWVSGAVVVSDGSRFQLKFKR